MPGQDGGRDGGSLNGGGREGQNEEAEHKKEAASKAGDETTTMAANRPTQICVADIACQPLPRHARGKRAEAREGRHSAAGTRDRA